MSDSAITIALAGNPNSGKTTLFNDLTGSSQHVGNWPGVTVEKKEGRLKGKKNIIIQDLPGIYSLAPYSPEEIITRNFLIKDKPDVILNIVDASNLERNLYLTTQITELGIPVVLALNMSDIVKKRGDIIDMERLSKQLGVAVVETSALKGQGCKNAAEKALWLAEEHALHPHGLDAKHDHAHDIFTPEWRFAAPVEKVLDEMAACIAPYVKDANVRWYAIKLFERDADIRARFAFTDEETQQLDAIIERAEAQFDDDSESIIANERYSFITKVIADTVTLKDADTLTISDKIDRVVTNRLLALPIFAFVMFAVYYIAISAVGTAMTDWVNDVLFGEFVPGVVEGFLESAGTAEWLNALLLDGIIAGVGAVLGFLPQMLVLFLLLALLEDCGYMARIAFIMDRVFKRFGLSGKSFIPILIGTGCGVPGILASRTIENESNRRLTVMTTTFIPCGAKLPIIALIAGALFPGSIWVAPSAYFVGIAAIITSGIILKKIRLFAGDPSPFLIELPAYHPPRPAGVVRIMLERGWAFVKRAGTIILLACMGVWFLSSFSWTLEMVDASDSMLASIGGFIAPIFDPLGWGDWRAATATVTGLVAKENVVGTFGVLYGFAEVGEEGAEYWPLLVASFTQLAAYSFLLFNLLCAPCFAAIGAIHREMASPRWTFIAIGYQCVFAYFVAFSFYQVGMLVTGNGFTLVTAIACILIAAFLFLLFRPGSKPKSKQSLALSEAAKATN